MRQDNPMLGQLQAEYEANPHFAALADSVAQDVLDCSFEEAMNAHPEAETTELQLLGTGMRLVCNAIFKMYGGPPARPFDAALFCRAQREMERFASQVQGFRYEHPESGGHIHIVRDLSLPRDQNVWQMVEDHSKCVESEEAAKAEYDRCHSAMMCAIQERQIQMAWTHYLWGTTSGAFDKEEES